MIQIKNLATLKVLSVGALLAVLAPMVTAQKSSAQDLVREETTIYRQSTTPAAQQTQQTVSSDDVNDDPQDFVGRQISVRGEVDKVYGPNSLRLKDGELVVFTSSPLPTQISNDDKVMIVGELRPAAPGEFEQVQPVFGNGPRNTYGYYNANPEYVLTAREVQIMDNNN